MYDNHEEERRLSLVLYLDRHWPELTLRAASQLSPESMEPAKRELHALIKDTLTSS